MILIYLEKKLSLDPVSSSSALGREFQVLNIPSFIGLYELFGQDIQVKIT